MEKTKLTYMSLPRTKPITLIRIGLGLVFLANALTAFFAPSEFIELTEKSFLINILPVSASAFVVGIGINDTLVAILLFLNLGKRSVAMWATIWLVGVMIVRGTPLNILEESGFLFMAIALVSNNNQKE